jgi:hypothetical protein
MSPRAARDGLLSAVARNGALAAASVLLAVALAELALRAIGFSYPNFWVPDPLTGSALRPGMEGWQQTEGRAYVRVNSRGLRDREHALPKPPRTYRIAILGDSYAEAIQVEMEQTFWALLPARLARCNFADGRRVEPVNFGVSGYGTALQLITLRERVWQYEPDLVLLAFFPGNDVRNNSRRLEDEPGRPYFELRDGALRLDNDILADPAFVARQQTAAARASLQKLRLYQLLRRVKAGHDTRGQHNAPIAAALAGGGAVATLAERGLDENAFRPPRDPAWREAWDLTDRLLLKVHEEVAARGARFVLVVLSTPGTVYPDPAMRERYAASLGVQTLFYPDERLERLGRERGFQVVPLGPPMQKLADASNTYYHGFPNTRLGFGHWNPAGHAAAAELIAEALCAGRHDPERQLVHPEWAPPASRVALPR